jgi:hypothetical protein
MKERSVYFCLQIPLKLASASSKQIGGSQILIWAGCTCGLELELVIQFRITSQC